MKKTSVARVVSVVVIGMLIWAGCSKKGSGPDQPKPFNQAVITMYVTSPLPAGFTFRLWAKAADTSLPAAIQPWVSLTRFNLNSTGGLLDSNGTAIASNRVTNLPVNLDDYDSLEITIERVGSLAATPGPTVYLHGRLPADLSTSHLPKLEFPFTFGEGQSGFLILTPTDADTSNELSGVWFQSRYPSVGPVDSGLTIPPAPAGWVYEGWVRHQSASLSTGKFRRAVGTDLSNPYCGPLTKPEFPGEDFLLNAPAGLGFTFPITLTRGDMISVAIEPDFDAGLGSYGVTLLSDTLSGTVLPYALALLNWSLEESYPSATMDIGRAGK